MNIAIVGYGKMGQEIHKQAESKGIAVERIIDPKHESATHRSVTAESLANVDVAIDFTHPDAILDNVKQYAAHGTNVVVGTTGWYDSMDEYKAIVENSGIGMIWSGNFSLGVNIMFSIIERAGSIMNKFEEYDVAVHEFHHNQKADSPSGTAAMMGRIILDTMDRKETMNVNSVHEKIDPKELHVSSTRVGHVPGTHSVVFDSPADHIELKHLARNRAGFASGSLLAAQWIAGKKGMFDIKAMMNDIIGEDNA